MKKKQLTDLHVHSGYFTWETVIKMDNQQRQCRVHILLLFGCSSPSGSDGVESEGKS